MAPPTVDAEPAEDTVERAHETDIPFQYTREVRYDRTDLDLREDKPFTSGWAVVDGGVTRTREIKLMSRGYLWEDGTENGERYKIQVRRPGPPDDLDPFATYNVWYRFAPIAVRTEPEFEVEPKGDGETRRNETEFESVPTPLQHHLVRLELVRNPPLARYALRDIGRWEEFSDAFRWEPEAFS